ncbi:tRNA uracil 4-sulfurtransferase ThiI [Acetivibrio clariflavus]|uniref:Probable tRNA sulfurtransferase n=1 Tax=Acetivibrio clariflavus (strain DSM 19732 / NBRC 101661 / EBR45) TaxID=720554 RepID=G8M1B4_ACECE|nr:tRNA uracil 4-sulfurtransferase ThiI [Acetivibrio clariflavus]AEV68090.1 thiazole biosynthesis/tRNA modification protein ThiI [Acetivibrio clariflavus DSM 19732]
MKKVILVRYGEILLKGLNRPLFEKKLIDNIKRAIYKLGKIEVSRSQARIYIEPQDENYDFDEAINLLTKVFGIVSVSPVWKIETDFEVIKEKSAVMVKDLLGRKGYKTFKVETKRGDKRFSMDSPEISRELGAHILESFPQLSVEVKNPDFILYVEVREFTYIYSEIIPAVCGMPIGTNSKAVLLLSGGIDSPVAGWMIAKRGVEIEAVHFYSYPYTSERAKEKVIDLAKILSQYCQKIKLHIVPFTDIQLEIYEKCPQDQLTIIMRRAMMIIAERIAEKAGALALVTGESVGQVASQTMQSLYVTNSVVKMPVFRPLIGMDKNEVIEIARKIGTFETSILPYEDCCTVFVSKHPKTKPVLEKILLSEQKANLEELINKAIENTEVLVIGSN